MTAAPPTANPAIRCAAVSKLVPDPKVQRLAQLLLGLVLFGFSLSLLVRADLGLPPWDVLHQGVAESIDLPLGSVVSPTSTALQMVPMPGRSRSGIHSRSTTTLVAITTEPSGKSIDSATP